MIKSVETKYLSFESIFHQSTLLMPNSSVSKALHTITLLLHKLMRFIFDFGT